MRSVLSVLRPIAATLAAASLYVGAPAALAAPGTWVPQEGIENLPRGESAVQQTATLGWVFHPITNGAEVTAFFGQLQDTDCIGGNVKLMYFAHDAYGEWTSYGWEGGDIDGAIAWVQAQHGTGALSRDVTYGHTISTATPVAPAAMKNGIFASDPNADLFAQMSPDAASTVISWLVESGYAAAPKLAEVLITEQQGGVKVLNNLMGFLSNQAEYTLYPLKTTYVTVSAAAWCSCTVVPGTPTVLQPPGAPTIVPHAVRSVNGECWYKFTRPIRTRTLTATGREWYCPSCAGTSTQTQTESTWVLGNCPPAAAPTTVPGNAEWSEDEYK